MTIWRNRIVRYGQEDPGQLLANPLNPRIHPQAQQSALKGALEEVGWLQDVIVNLRTSEEWGQDQGVETMLDGHLRVKLALRHGQGEVPVKYVDLNPKEERLALATLDAITNEATIDPEIMADLLVGMEIDNLDLSEFIANMATELNIDLGGEEPPEDPGADIDRAAELQEKWQVKLGDLWVVPSKTVSGGEHRLICGDCTDAAVVERVMGGVKAFMVWTDPPYGVNYGEKLDATNPMGYRVRDIENDALSSDELENLIRTAYFLASKHTVPGAALYAACPAGTPLPTAIAAFKDSGFDFRWQLVWVKDQLVLSRADYHFRHENVLYGWKPDGAHYFTDDRTQDSVFEIPRPKRSDEHPTMKPPPLIEQMLRNSSKDGDIVYDPFCGSGSTIVACERTGRLGIGCDIESRYTAVTLERLQGMGLEPHLMEESA